MIISFFCSSIFWYSSPRNTAKGQMNARDKRGSKVMMDWCGGVWSRERKTKVIVAKKETSGSSKSETAKIRQYMRKKSGEYWPPVEFTMVITRIVKTNASVRR